MKSHEKMLGLRRVVYSEEIQASRRLRNAHSLTQALVLSVDSEKGRYRELERISSAIRPLLDKSRRNCEKISNVPGGRTVRTCECASNPKIAYPLASADGTEKIVRKFFTSPSSGRWWLVRVIACDVIFMAFSMAATRWWTWLSKRCHSSVFCDRFSAFSPLASHPATKVISNLEYFLYPHRLVSSAALFSTGFDASENVTDF